MKLEGCANAPHGSLCDLRCHPGYVRSGELLCAFGVYRGGSCVRELAEVRNEPGVTESSLRGRPLYHPE